MMASEPANSNVEEIVLPPVVESISRPNLEVIKPSSTTKDEAQKADVEVVQIAEIFSPITAADGSADSPVDETQHTGGDDSGLVNNRNLVGDGSWEEKTWKEVVRLREEMFCARMGVVR
jgi:hypothetical protein